jgi:hypothetical protein
MPFVETTSTARRLATASIQEWSELRLPTVADPCLTQAGINFHLQEALKLFEAMEKFDGAKAALIDKDNGRDAVHSAYLNEADKRGYQRDVSGRIFELLVGPPANIYCTLLTV